MADDETLRMVTAFIAGVSATMAVVGSLISWRNYKRARDIDGTRLFWDLRKDAISEQHREYMAETARLLLQYDLKSKDIPSTPEISRLLNHLDWVGYFVKKHVISMEEASSTFGNDILHLYPALFDYICKQRQDRGYRSLWDKVDYLFKQLAKYMKKHHNYGIQSEDEKEKMRRFIAKHPRTRKQLKEFFQAQLPPEPNKGT